MNYYNANLQIRLRANANDANRIRVIGISFAYWHYIQMKLKKGDNVLIISGKDKGKTGKILKSFPKKGQVLVEGANIKKKHVKPKREGEKGQLIKVSAALDVSNAKFICPKCGKATRVGYKINNGKKLRICKKCKSEV